MLGFDTTFKALADPTRRRILNLLRTAGPQNAGELATALEVAGTALSFHLRILKQANLIFDRRNGQFIVYRLNTSVMEELLRFLLDQFGSQAGATRQSGDEVSAIGKALTLHEKPAPLDPEVAPNGKTREAMGPMASTDGETEEAASC